MIKVTDLEPFILIACTLKFGVKSSLVEGGGTLAGGIREPMLTCSSFVLKYHPDLSLQILVS